MALSDDTREKYEHGPYKAQNIEMLRRLRQHCKDLDAAANSAEKLHFVSAQELKDRTQLLALSICYVPVPCYICHEIQDVAVRVGDYATEPNFTVCNRCQI